MVPGDVIEWVYKSSNKVVDKDEELWSSTMEQWVPIGSCFTHILISIENEQMSWLNEQGCFHARVDDVVNSDPKGTFPRVLPHMRDNFLAVVPRKKSQ